jgi:ArsR family transcriptional regulator
MDATVIDLAEKQAAFCRVVGHSRRLLILWSLSEGELSVNEIAAHVGSTLQNISQHLTLLKKEGIVATRRQGQTIYYRIADHACTRGCPALLRSPDMLEWHSPKKENLS